MAVSSSIGLAAVPEGVPPVDLRKHDVNNVLTCVERGLGVSLDTTSVVRKRRSVGARSDRGTWVRVELRSLARVEAEGQPGDGIEAAGLVAGVALPKWHGAMSWHDPVLRVVWRADETDLITVAPVKAGGTLRHAPELSGAWWDTLNGSLDALATARTTRVATPDTQVITPELVAAVIGRVFPGQVDATITDHTWRPAHADLNWSNLTGPDCWFLDWEDFGLAPRGLDAATLWVDSLGEPSLAERVHQERRADLDSWPGRIMALFCLSKILADTGANSGPISTAAAREAARLVADLRQ